MRSVLMVLVAPWSSLIMLQAVLLDHRTQDETVNPTHKQGAVGSAGPQGSVEVFYPVLVPYESGYPHPHHERGRVERSVASTPVHAKYRIDAFGKVLTLNLTLFSEFISPGFIIQRVKGNYSWLEEVNDGELVTCFYSGKVDGYDDSQATFSLCNGMSGVIHLPHEKYFIQPSSKNLSSSFPEHQPHIIRRHPVIYHDMEEAATHQQRTSHCSVTENYKHHRLKGETDQRHSSSDIKNSVFHKRRKRSASHKRFVETLVVADSSMRDYHGSHLEHYVMTLMAMVTSIYKHPSIGNFIHIVVVKLILLDTPQDGPNITQNAMKTLEEFCHWQSNINTKESSSDHHDTAILITRKDICRASKKCDTLGLAEMGTICDEKRSCSIIEDNGISAAYTIAHELGHVFSLSHDDNTKCSGLETRSGKKYHVMAPTLDYDSSPWDWSRCSAKYLTEFIDAGLAECLLDKPRVRKYHQKMTAAMLHAPGQLYDVNKQCEMVFGKGYVLCPHMQTCERLWCTNSSHKSSGCRTQHMPWADGSTCMDPRNKHCKEKKCWCRRGECVIKIPPKTLSGGWGNWQKYGVCSRSCGGGIKTSIRKCDSPTPADGGRYCLGKRVKYRSCNTKACPPSTMDFREQQCANFSNKYHINGLPPNALWVPKYSGVRLKDACKLLCRAQTTSTYYQMADKVIDGTKCGPDTDDICVNGKCRRAGCENRLGSRMKRDQCGICGGDNSSCRTVKGAFNNRIYGYNRVVTIPAGATNILVTQNGMEKAKDDDNYLALKNARGNYILNGDFIVRTERWKIKVQSGILEYSGANQAMEKINSSRIIGEPITVDVLSVGRLLPPNIEYSYTISVGPYVTFRWTNKGPWKKCSRICHGKRKRKIVCIRADDNLLVSSKHCKGMPRPERLRENCNTRCNVEWKVLNEMPCPVACGKAMRARVVYCITNADGTLKITDDKNCRHLGAKPATYVVCQGKCLSTYWSYTDWSPCSKTCGGGKQYRQSRCVDDEENDVPDERCSKKERILSQACNEQPCALWETSEWTGCSVSCGTGKRHRKVWCSRGDDIVGNSFCDNKKKPGTKKECNMGTCPEWFTGGWGPCSSSCGKGEHMRAVRCRSPRGNILIDSICDAASRPIDKRSCFLGSCPTSPPPTTPTTEESTSAYWRFGSWTECSATCGPGTHHRYVSCMDNQGTRISNALCSHLPKPVSMETCIRKLCGEWRLGTWSSCPVTCGEGVKTRYVACVVFDQPVQNENMCNKTIRPVAEVLCNEGTCQTPDDFDIAVITSNSVEATSHWRVGPWTHCSSTCGTGWQRRLVVCQDERGQSEACDMSQKPREVRDCDSGYCPKWVHGDWTECSALCQEQGQQSRHVLCQLPNSQMLEESNCDITRRPADTRLCIGSCNTSTNHWHEKPWSSCSVTCGRGHRRREVLCVDPDGHEQPSTSCPRKKPRNSKRCYRGNCPRWHTGRWSKCSVTCGTGVKRRAVNCKSRQGPAQCLSYDKPPVFSPCVRKKCSKYLWKTDAWSQCSKTCGFGKKERFVTCVDLHGSEVSPHLCDIDNKPKIRRRCSEFPCPYIWNTSPWTECSATCGEGQQSRRVICQSVTREGWILPGEAPYSCRREERPPEFRYCNYGDCGAHFHWRVGPWGDCSAKCGSGKQRRIIQCVSAGQKRSKRRCVRLYRPKSIRSCYNGPCYARSCKELKELTTIRMDGDYKILVNNQLVTIYCKNMRKQTPLEYLTLSRSENYAEVFDKRLKRPRICPYNGTRPGWCNKCRKKTYRQAGNTTYSKIRVDLNTLRIIFNDGTFSTVHTGKFIPYGTAGDCYSSDACPQGRFSINLAGTGFIVSVNTTWTLAGNKASQRIWRLRDGEIIRGVCGGYCGVCSPDMKTGLQIQLFQ
ncbi:A disintegrin and metalloproteinase with thrombospondin motifs 9-like [Gigantopelta aegis]|uniref:A disintegrin and metalloproteinase with thrombospondin motifs 9-like n=1 Tax=Gigantopelta aegis TaxID=1735272 RepID=UPI001B88B938|nr:A disintegrin and metalloproteinase with thrombospondin motifs 9-like [Gigantopelta aegis]